MHTRQLLPLFACGLLIVSVSALIAGETVATAVYSRVGSGYQRKRLADGRFKPEYYALANGGRIAGTGSDATIDKVRYPEVADIAMRMLAQKDYLYARSKEEAKIMIVLHWGATVAFNGGNYVLGVNEAASALSSLTALGGGPGGSVGQGGGNPFASASDVVIQAAEESFENAMLRVMMENRTRDQVNLPNARLLGYLDDINESNDIRRWAGGGDRYTDLIADIEESRYYIIISAYDFDQLVNRNTKKLLWQTRVSVRSPGNRFDDSVVAMMKGASKYFGEDSGRLVRGEESKGVVEMGELKFLGEAKEPVSAKKQGAK